jgi:hypothetical protein
VVGCTSLLIILPPLLYPPGVKGAENGLFPIAYNTDNPVTKIATKCLIPTKWTTADKVQHSIWLLGGTSNVYVEWQWLVAFVMLLVFLAYYFIEGRKGGENYKTLGFKTSDEKKFSIVYLLKSLLFGICVVGTGYVLMALIGKYTQQGLHIATRQMSNLSRKRLMCWPIYFLYLIPYFLCNHLAVRSIGIEYDGTDKNLVLNVVKTTLITIGGLIVFYLMVLFQLKFTHCHGRLPHRHSLRLCSCNPAIDYRHHSRKRSQRICILQDTQRLGRSLHRSPLGCMDSLQCRRAYKRHDFLAKPRSKKHRIFNPCCLFQNQSHLKNSALMDQGPT